MVHHSGPIEVQHLHSLCKQGPREGAQSTCGPAALFAYILVRLWSEESAAPSFSKAGCAGQSLRNGLPASVPEMGEGPLGKRPVAKRRGDVLIEQCLFGSQKTDDHHVLHESVAL